MGIFFDTRIESEDEVMTTFIETEMHKVEDKVLRKLSSIFVHQQFFSIKDFALMLAYSFYEDHKPAVKITNSLDLSKLDFLAVMEDFDGFKEEYLKDIGLAQNF